MSIWRPGYHMSQAALCVCREKVKTVNKKESLWELEISCYNVIPKIFSKR